MCQRTCNKMPLNLNPLDFFPAVFSEEFKPNLPPKECEETCTSSIKGFFYQFFNFFLCVIALLVIAYAYNQSVTIYNASRQTMVCAPPETRLNKEIVEENGNAVSQLQWELEKLKEQIGILLVFQANVENQLTTPSVSAKEVDSHIEKALKTREADGIGVKDYASRLAGGSIVSVQGMEAYSTNKTIQIFKFFHVGVVAQPERILDADNSVGNCYAFCGSSGAIRIKLGKPIKVVAVTMDHAPFALLDDITHAPRDFAVYGLLMSNSESGIFLGRFTFKAENNHIQSFLIHEQNVGEFEFIELQIFNNHGNPEYTCLYRFRVHSKKPLVIN